MAMVIAKRGKSVIKVSKSAYEKLFKGKGYRVIHEDGEVKEAEQKQEVKEEREEQTQKEIETIPISEMNKEQLAEYAKEHNIDTSSARNVREARQIIQKAKREAEM